ncbi:MAG: hypothetical protein WCJ35_06335 [Planctomycetota bacterium]
MDDAENAPWKLGFSHDTRGGSRNENGRAIVELIDKVLSVDLVANPATTEGLFESCDHNLYDRVQERLRHRYAGIPPLEASLCIRMRRFIR